MSRQGIHDLVQRGVLQLGDDGLLDTEEAKRVILTEMHPASKSAKALAAAAPAKPVPVADPTAHAPAADAAPVITNYHMARTLREAAEAKLADLKLKQRKGELIRVDAVRGVMTNIFTTVREAILQIPARMGPVLAAESEPAVIQTKLYDELHAALVRLAESGAAIDKLASEPPKQVGRPPKNRDDDEQ